MIVVYSQIWSSGKPQNTSRASFLGVTTNHFHRLLSYLCQPRIVCLTTTKILLKLSTKYRGEPRIFHHGGNTNGRVHQDIVSLNSPHPLSQVWMLTRMITTAVSDVAAARCIFTSPNPDYLHMIN